MFRRTIRFVAKTVAVVTVASGAGVLLAKYVMDSMHHSVGIEKQLKNLPDEIKVWANEGKSESIRRPGHVDTKHGNSMDYRHLMTKVDDALSIDNNNTQGFSKTSSRM